MRFCSCRTWQLVLRYLHLLGTSLINCPFALSSIFPKFVMGGCIHARFPSDFQTFYYHHIKTCCWHVCGCIISLFNACYVPCDILWVLNLIDWQLCGLLFVGLLSEINGHLIIGLLIVIRMTRQHCWSRQIFGMQVFVKVFLRSH